MTTRNLAVAWGVAPVANGQTWYTVPAGEVFILKSVLVSQTGNVGGNVTLYVIDSPATSLVELAHIDLTSERCQLLLPWIVLLEHQAVVASVDTNPVAYWISGALLPTPAAVPRR